MTDYIEKQLESENPFFLKWENSDGTIWYTDMNLKMLGLDLEEALENYK